MLRSTRVVLVAGLFVALSAVERAGAQEGQFAFRFWPGPGRPAPDLNRDCVENDGPRWPGRHVIAGLPGTVVRATYYCGLWQRDRCVQPNPTSPLTCESGTPGAQGWQMSFTASGCDAAILAITTAQTNIAPGDITSCELGPAGSGGFDNTELALAENNGGTAGAVSTVLLHLKKLTTLDPSGLKTAPATGARQNPATVCRFLVEYTIPGTEGDSCGLTFRYVDGLQGLGQSVDNEVTQDGQSVIPQTLGLTFRVIAGPPFQVPGDGNQDGAIDLSDVIHFLDFLFKGNLVSLPCSTQAGNLALMDCNGDGALDISDAIYKLCWLFTCGPGPVQGSGCIELADCAANPSCP